MFKNFVKENQKKPGDQRSDSWYHKVTTLNKRMTSNGYNIRTADSTCQKNPEKTHNMDMIEEEVNFYEDNCHVGYIARRKPTVCKKSQEIQNRMEKRSISLEEKL